MCKATWLLVVSIFADMCILAHPETTEMLEFFKDLENMGITIKDRRLYNKESEPVKFEELRSGFRSKIFETYTESAPLNGLTTTSKYFCTEQNKSSEQSSGPGASETMKVTGLSQGPADDMLPIPWRLDHGQDSGPSDLVGGQVSNEDPGFGHSLSMDGAQMPRFGESEGRTPDINWSTSTGPPSSGARGSEGNVARSGVHSPGLHYSPLQSGQVGGWVPGGGSGLSMVRDLVGISGLGMSQEQSWRSSLNMRSNVEMHSGPVRDLGQNALSGTPGPPQSGGHRSQARTSSQDVPGERRRSLVHGTKYGLNARKMMEDFIIHPTRKPGSKFKHRTFDEKLFRPGHSQEESNELDKQEDLLKYLPKPTTKHPFLGYDPSIREDQLPEYRGGKLPGPGSEGEYPNGYRINYNALMNANRKPPGGSHPYGMRQQHTGGFPNAGQMSPRQVPLNPSGLRQGALSMDDYYFSANPANQYNALRMGDPKLEAKEGIQPGMAGGNMTRVPPSGYKPGELSPGMGRVPPPGYNPMGQSPAMGGAPSPGYMQGRLPPVMGAGPPPGYMQGGQPPGMRGDFLPEHEKGALPDAGGLPPGYRDEVQPPGMGGGYLPEYLQRGGVPDMNGISIIQNMQGGQPIMRRGIPPE